MVEIAAGTQFSEHLPDSAAFTFGYSLGNDGRIVLGDGSDENPLVIGITTKFLLKAANRDPSTFVFHMDATLRLVLCDYPLMSTAVQYAHALRSLMSWYKGVVGKYLTASYFMDDAEDAQYKGFEQTLALSTDHTTPTYLMCFFHVVENVKKRLGGLSNNTKHLVFRYIYEMHYATSELEYNEFVEKADSVWRAVPELNNFAGYFQKVWIKSLFCKWQCFWSPPGFAKTNNPVDQFNKVIKRDYTLRVRMKLCALLQKVISMAHHRSLAFPHFSTETRPSLTLISRTKQLLKAGKLLVTQSRQTLQFLLGGVSGMTNAYVGKSLVHSIENAKVAELGERTNRRMERLGQPHGGWTVDVDTKSCPCKAWFKCGNCVHLLAGLRSANQPIHGWAGTERRFVNRRVKRAKTDRNSQGGRPAVVSHALTLD